MGVIGVVARARHRVATPPQQPEPLRRRERAFPWRLAIVAGLIVLTVAVGPGWIRGLLPSFPNPFAAETVDRSAPAVLQSIRDLREYRAASGEFQVLVDLEKDTALPAAILGERTLFLAAGTVDVGVDFSSLGPGAVKVSPDRRSAVITLPPPRLSEAELDLERSHVVNRKQGVLNEIGLLFSDERNTEREVYLLAEEKLNAAAAASPRLLPRAKANTRATLETLLRSLGFRRVDVRFVSPL
jgi:Protein of unknown function (DUF4230)